MQYRLIATDMDGTLLNEHSVIAPRVRTVVAELQECGVMVVLSSGRAPRSMRPFYEELGLTTPVIAYNGAYIFQPGVAEPIQERSLDQEVALGLVAELRAVDPTINLQLETSNEFHVDRIDAGLAAGLIKGLPAPSSVGDVAKAIRTSARKVTKLIVPAGAAVRAAATERFARAGLTAQMAITAGDAHSFEIIPAGVNKGQALLLLAERLGIPQAATVALGDAENDVEALQVAGLGIAMGNALPPAMQAADVVTGPNTADGWAEAMGRYVLNVLPR